MKKKYKVTLPGNELVKMKLGFFLYYKTKTIIVESDSLYSVYNRYPLAINIKELKEYEYLNNSILYFDKDKF
jgi:hypothetical protein